MKKPMMYEAIRISEDGYRISLGFFVDLEELKKKLAWIRTTLPGGTLEVYGIVKQRMPELEK
jgi:hypothetical protein